MVIINAYLGAGSGSGVPVGKCMLNVVWNPSDGANKSGATVKAVIGSTTVQGTTDANGMVSLLVGTGSCTVTVTPTAGTYTGKTATVTAESTTTKTVVVNGFAPRTIVLYSPYTIKSTAWSLKQGSTTVASGTTFSSGNKNYSLNDATYVFSITAFGITRTKSFTTSQANTFIDLTDMFCKVTISGGTGLTITSTFAGTSMGTGRTQYVVRGSTAIAYTGTVSQKINNTAIATVANTTFTPTNTTATVTLTVTGQVFLFTSTQDVAIPLKANYKVLVIGGGGGAETYNSTASSSYQGIDAGSSGQLKISTINIPVGTYTVTVGAGGAIGYNGGASSFGSLLSANGGNYGSANPSDEGKSGGGSYSTGGKGMGGASAGSAGQALDNSDHFYTSVGSSYAAGTSRATTNGGGAGGIGAKGGNQGTNVANTATYYYYGGCGGGGGIAGGDGGAGSNVTGDQTSQYQKTGANGKGYGSGGAGKGRSYYVRSRGDYGGYDYHGGGGGAGGLYNVAGHATAQHGNPGAVQIMWVG